MIGWEPRRGVEGPWHLTGHRTEYPAVGFCGVRVQGLDLYVQQDPLKIDKYHGERCPNCWTEWGLRIAASYAQQDQWEAGRA